MKKDIWKRSATQNPTNQLSQIVCKFYFVFWKSIIDEDTFSGETNLNLNEFKKNIFFVMSSFFLTGLKSYSNNLSKKGTTFCCFFAPLDAMEFFEAPSRFKAWVVGPFSHSPVFEIGFYVSPQTVSHSASATPKRKKPTSSLHHSKSQGNRCGPSSTNQLWCYILSILFSAYDR